MIELPGNDPILEWHQKSVCEKRRFKRRLHPYTIFANWKLMRKKLIQIQTRNEILVLKWHLFLSKARQVLAGTNLYTDCWYCSNYFFSLSLSSLCPVDLKRATINKIFEIDWTKYMLLFAYESIKKKIEIKMFNLFSIFANLIYI